LAGRELANCRALAALASIDDQDCFWRWLDRVADAMIAIVARGVSPRTVRLVENEEGQFVIVVADKGGCADWSFTRKTSSTAEVSCAAQSLTSDQSEMSIIYQTARHDGNGNAVTTAACAQQSSGT
jgi:hypothetical protein